MALKTTKDLAAEMLLHPRTVKRWWKKLGVPPDACAGNGCHRWTEQGAARLKKLWHDYWQVRGRYPDIVKLKAEGKFTEKLAGQIELPLQERFHFNAKPQFRNFARAMEPGERSTKTRMVKTTRTHNQTVERAALGCVILEVIGGKSPNEQDALLQQLKISLFYDLRHREIFTAMVQLRMANHALDAITLAEWLRAEKKITAAGGMEYITVLGDDVPSVFNFPTYLATLRDKALRRWTLTIQTKLGALAHAEELSPEQLREEFAEIYDRSEKIGQTQKSLIEIVSPEEAKQYEPDENDFFVGRGLIMRGQVFCIGGAPGVGKSRLATTLALAGAGAANTWMNYPVCAKWRTLMIQTENNGFRLKEECDAIPKRFSEFIRITRELPLGMAFGNPEFRRQLLAAYDKWPFELLTIDPLNDLVTEDGQTDFKMALQNIRQIFVGRRMPAICFVAHLRKARGDSSTNRPKSGRQLLSELSGTLAIGSTARAVFVVQAASNDMSDSRVVFEVAKSSDVNPEFFKEYGSRTAWHRANGAFEKVEDFDWHAWDNPLESNEQRRAVTPEMLKQVLDDSDGMLLWEISKAISAEFGIGKSTVARAIGEHGYLRQLIKPVPKGGFALK